MSLHPTQVYNNIDLTYAGSNLYNSYPCTTASQSSTGLPALTGSAVSSFQQNPWMNGPPFTYTCADVQPLHRLIGGSSNYTNTTADLVNSGIAVGSGTSNSTTTQFVSGSGGIYFSALNQSFSTLPSVYSGATGVTVSFWINQFTGGAYMPVITLGNGLYMYVSSSYGICIASGSPITINPAYCNTFFAYSLANVPTPSVANTWNHYIFVASASGTYSLYQNGVLEQTSGSATTLLAWNQYYGSNVVQIGVAANSATGRFTLGDLQVYNQDLGAYAPNLFFGGVCANATFAYSSNTSSKVSKTIAPWISAGLTTVSSIATNGNLTNNAAAFNEWPVAALTSAATSGLSGPGAYGGGTYNSASSSAITSWNAFDKSSATSWVGVAVSPSYYSTGTYSGLYSTTLLNSVVIAGEYLQIQFPSTMTTIGYAMTQTSATYATSPVAWTVVASNDGASWVSIDSQTGISWSSATITQQFPLSTAVAYSYYRLIVTAVPAGFVAGTTAGPSIAELRFYSRDGIPESTTCSDTVPLSRIIGGMSAATLANVIANTGSYYTNYYTSINSHYGNVSTAGDALSFTNAIGGSFARTLPIAYPTGFSAVLWMKFSNFTSTFVSIAQFAPGINLFLSSNGICLLGGNTLTMTTGLGTPSCSGLAGLNGTYLTATAFNKNLNTYTWTQVAVTGSAANGYNMYVNGLLAQTSAGGTMNGAPEYPPAALSALSNTVTGYLVNGLYNVSTSATSNAWTAFDKLGSLSANYWASAAATYATTGVYAGTAVTPGVGFGEWIKLTTPTAVVVSSYTISAREDASFTLAPYTWKVAGSNDNGTTWTVIDSRTAVVFAQAETKTFLISSPTTYSAYILVMIASTPTVATTVSFTELRFFGPSVPTYSKYHSASVEVAMGFFTPIAPPSAANLLAGDFQTYGSDLSANNGIASAYFGGNCSSIATSFSTALALGGPTHSYLSSGSAGVGVIPLTVADVVDTVGSYGGILTTFTWAGQGLGVPISSTAYAKLGDGSGNAVIDWGYGAQAGTGFTVGFWVQRTTAATVASVTTQLAQFVASVGSVNAQSGFSVAIRSSTTTLGNSIYVSWPGCGFASSATPGAVFVSPSVTGTTLGTAGSGMHHIVVSFSSTLHLRVYVDGVEWVYEQVFNNAVFSSCTLGNSEWPYSFITSASYIGGWNGTTETTPTYALTSVDIWNRQLSASEVMQMSGGSVYPIAGTPPPPPPYLAPISTLQGRLTACGGVGPTHRYGSVGAYPFVNGLATDYGTQVAAGSPWNAPYTSSNALPTTPSSGNLLTISMATGSLYTNNAGLDFGTRTWSSTTGITIMWMTTNTLGQCSSTQTQTSNNTYVAATSLTYFDFGGYSLYVNGTCSPGLVTLGGTITTMTGPFSYGTYAGPGTYRSPVVPALDAKYTAVVISTTGTSVYVNGYLWATFPTVTWTAGFLSQNTRFFGGNMLVTSATALTIHDLQIYEYPLTNTAVVALANGRSSAC